MSIHPKTIVKPNKIRYEYGDFRGNLPKLFGDGYEILLKSNLISKANMRQPPLLLPGEEAE